MGIVRIQKYVHFNSIKFTLMTSLGPFHQNEQENNGFSCIWSMFSTISRYSTTKTEKYINVLLTFISNYIWYVCCRK